MHKAVVWTESQKSDSVIEKKCQDGNPLQLVSAKLKLVNACNLRCFMCDYWKQRRKEELKTEEVTSLLSQLAEEGCQKVHFTGGEIFLRKDIVTLISHAANCGMRTNLTTNGTLTKKEQVDELMKIPLRSMTVSIDSPAPNIHDEIRGKKGALKLTLKTLDRAFKKRGGKTRIRVNTVVNRRNFKTLVEIPKLTQRFPVDGWLLIPMDPGSGWDDAMTPTQVNHYNSNIAPLLAETVKVPGFDPFIYGRETSADKVNAHQWGQGYYDDNPCYAPFFHLLVDSKGTVWPCCMGHKTMDKLGNIRRETLSEIWNGPRYQAFRKRLYSKRDDVCHRCDDFLKDNRQIAQIRSRKL